MGGGVERQCVWSRPCPADQGKRKAQVEYPKGSIPLELPSSQRNQSMRDVAGVLQR